NVDFTASDRLTLRSSLSVAREVNDRIPGDNSNLGIVTNAIGEPPTQPIFAANGAFSGAAQHLLYANPAAIAAYNNQPSTTERFIGSVDGTYRLVGPLSITARAGTDVLVLHEDEWDSPLVDQSFAHNIAGQAKSAYSTANRNVLESFLTLAQQHNTGSSYSV